MISTLVIVTVRKFLFVSKIIINNIVFYGLYLQGLILTSSTSLSKAIIASGADRLELVDMVVPTGDASLMYPW